MHHFTHFFLISAQHDDNNVGHLRHSTLAVSTELAEANQKKAELKEN